MRFNFDLLDWLKIFIDKVENRQRKRNEVTDFMKTLYWAQQSSFDGRVFDSQDHRCYFSQVLTSFPFSSSWCASVLCFMKNICFQKIRDWLSSPSIKWATDLFVWIQLSVFKIYRHKFLRPTLPVNCFPFLFLTLIQMSLETSWTIFS